MKDQGVVNCDNLQVVFHYVRIYPDLRSYIGVLFFNIGVYPDLNNIGVKNVNIGVFFQNFQNFLDFKKYSDLTTVTL